ncbi:hypothetical protein DNTS_025534 [Danionella cerebrum]|uniref:Glutaredoxin domain-containing protein n=1 Tax=Danionella cerebrum TaxID=2873325 RepID=A0A553MY75_9TELE|nr:hypothetical protein DNTS_025534 [Danionella translucida]
MSVNMEELQKTAGTSMEDKPRKVRFKLASSYSGRVLKHVYEDGQELDCPEEQYPHSFIQSKMEMGDACGLEDQQEPSPPRGLTAQRINVYRGVTGCNSMAFGDLSAGGDKEASCEHCGGSGSAPCSLCHGSKLSMLVNRFNESIRELRCPACNPHGQERCQSCTH